MINFLLVFFIISILYAATTSRIEANIKVLSIQGLIFFFIIILYYNSLSLPAFILLILETLAVKAILIPAILSYVVKKNNVYREMEPYIPNFYSLVITGLLFVLGFIMAYFAGQHAQDIKLFYFGISLSTIMAGLFLIMTRKKIITHIIGYMFIENGIFLLSLSVAHEMPLIVNLGILLDIFIGVFILVLYYNKIKTTFEQDKLHIDKLTYLKD